MRSSVMSGLLCFAPQLLKGLPQLQSQHLPSQQSQFSLAGATSQTQARAILVNPNGAPVFAVIDFHDVGSTGIQVEVVVHGLDQSIPHAGHPYHIHTNGVGPDGNCEAAGGHLTSLGIPDSVPCDPAKPHLCQEGNLSGKWGLLSGSQRDTKVSFTDPYLKFTPGPSGIIGRAVVLHDNKGGRIACGNIHLR